MVVWFHRWFPFLVAGGFPRWLIFYRVEESNLVLLRVRYAAMDLPALEMEG